MKIGFQIDWAGTIYYVSNGQFVYDNKQYTPDVISMTQLIRAGALWGDYETSYMTIELKDNRKTSYRTLLADENTRYISGGNVTVIETDGTIIGRYVLQEPGVNESTITLTFSDRLGELERKPINSDMVITSETFPAPEGSRGKTIPFFAGQFRAPTASEKGKNAIRAYRVTLDTYILGESGIVDTLTLQYVILPDGTTDVTGSSTLIAPTGSDPYYYVQYSATTEEYLDVNFNFPFYTTQQVGKSVGTRFFHKFQFRAVGGDGMTVFGANNWHFDSIASLRGGTYDTHYAIVDQVSGIQLLSELCKMLNVHCYLDRGKQIYFVSIDFANLSIKKSYQAGVSHTFFPNYPMADSSYETMNLVNAEIGYQYADRQPGDTVVFQKHESISRFGTRSTTTEFAINKMWGLSDSTTYPRADAKPHVALKKIMTEKSFPQRPRSFTCNIANVKNLDPLDIIQFSHPELESGENRLYLIRRISTDYSRNTVVLDTIDITRYGGLETDQVFLLQSNNADMSQNFYDDSIAGTNFLMGAAGGVAHDTSDSKYGNSAIIFNGTNQYLKFGNSERFFDFDPWHDLIFSVWMWVKFNATDTVEFICGQYENNTSDYWRILRRGPGNGSVLRFVAFEGGVNEITVDGATAVNDTNWHLVTFVKIYTTYAFYLDGVQDAHVIDVDTGTINEGFFIGCEFNGTSPTGFAAISIAALGIWKNNAGPLSSQLAPNAGLTDSFSPPVGLWGESTDAPLYAKV